ncbi:thioredoxin [Anaerosporobacter faecicola]|uniref:thioredoxin n=1 Tax=Anaerosporobacter faecicola TaxID=2718714 RepID=UPI001439B9B4|nr:thioredoxin [Anaerosporobacter faecicola]
MAFLFTDENFEKEALKCEQLVLVDFYADWCGPCKMMAPIVEELAEDFKDSAKIGKLNVDNSPATAAKYKVMSIPTMLLIKNGEVVDTVVGAISKAQLQEKIEANK